MGFYQSLTVRFDPSEGESACELLFFFRFIDNRKTSSSLDGLKGMTFPIFDPSFRFLGGRIPK